MSFSSVSIFCKMMDYYYMISFCFSRLLDTLSGSARNSSEFYSSLRIQADIHLIILFWICILLCRIVIVSVNVVASRVGLISVASLSVMSSKLKSGMSWLHQEVENIQHYLYFWYWIIRRIYSFQLRYLCAANSTLARIIHYALY